MLMLDAKEGDTTLTIPAIGQLAENLLHTTATEIYQMTNQVIFLHYTTQMKLYIII